METIMNGMCRCCASEGVYKDVKGTYTWMGEEEVYADMLRECFDISLSTSEHGEDGGICEVCITQLRNASNFKKQVQHTEEQFKKHVENKLFKPSIVKVEMTGDEDNDSDDNNLSAEEGFSAPEYEVPIKTESEEQKPKKRASTSKATTSRAKKAKNDNGESSTTHPSQTLKKNIISELKPARKKLKTIEIKPYEQPERKKGIKIIKIEPYDVSVKEEPVKNKWVPRSELNRQKENLRTILYNSNATPIGQYGGIGYGCCSCTEKFETPGELKNHTIITHNDDKMGFIENVQLVAFIVKLDITDLICTLCQTKIDSLFDLIEHLKSAHDINFHKERKDYILPFKFDDSSVYKCVICEHDYNNFKVLREHMNTHFKNYKCNVCSSGFVNKKILWSHTKRHKTGVFKCSYCMKEFNTIVKQQDHERAIHISCSKRSKCGYCGERFSDYTAKNKHEVKIHGAKPVVINCKACERTFDNQRSLTAHTKSYHLMRKGALNK